jgi:hypothetical protein
MKLSTLLIIVLGLWIIPEPVNAQKKDADKEKKIVFGGMIGLQFGSITSVEIAPSVGYYITPRLLSSLGISYQYYRESFNRSVFSSNIYGIRTSLSYAILDNIGKNLTSKSSFGVFTHAEYELLSLDRDFSNQLSREKVKRFWLPGLLVGIGIKQNLGKNSFFSISVLFNVIATSKTPYENPVLRVGVFF